MKTKILTLTLFLFNYPFNEGKWSAVKIAQLKFAPH